MKKIRILNLKKLKILFFSLASLYYTMTYANAHATSAHKKKIHAVSFTHRSRSSHLRTKEYRYRYHYHAHVIQCVAFARSASDVHLRGNARDWWNNAEGVYDKGKVPETNSVLSFRATRRMPLGHVAVVKQVINSRTIIIDQSHWAQGGISHNTPVIDVSANNDWSAVRVGLNGNKNSFGSIYPTHGFIYSDNTHDRHIRSAYPAAHTVHTWTANAATAPNNTEVALSPNISSDDLFGHDAPDRSLK